MTLAPPGTPLWHPQKDDFAPRLGVAWQSALRSGDQGRRRHLLRPWILRGGRWDRAHFHTLKQKFVLNTSFPLSDAAAAPPPFTTNPPVSYLAVVDPNHVLPRTYEWNAAVERAFGKADVITLTYLGAAGRKLMRRGHLPEPKSQLYANLNC